MTTRTLVYDIEANGLIFAEGNKSQADKVYCLVAIDANTNEQFIFNDYDDNYPSVKEGMEFINKEAKILAGHNIIGYDNALLWKLYGWRPREDIVIMDTMLMSQKLNYKRFGFGHSLANWGKAFKFPKDDFADRMEEKYGKGNAFAQYDPEMLPYCVRDVELNVKVFLYLMKEFRAYAKAKPLMKRSMRIEHDVAQFCAEAFVRGWKIDMPRAKSLLKEMKAEMTKIEEEIEPDLPMMVKKKDKEPVEPKYRKDGKYMKSTCDWFGLPPDDALVNNTVWGPYQRIEFIPAKLGNMDYVKEYLFTLGWEPLDFNWKKENGEFIKVSPKLCSESLKAIGPIGEKLDYYTTTRSRYGILKGWLEAVDDDGFLHGSCFTIATPTGRGRHSGIVNVPGAKSTWGKEMRELFITEEGNVMVGADSSGNQMRALCHYLKNDEYTAEVIDGDVHQRNADALGCSRDLAKPFLYAFLFGAGFAKLGLILTGKRDEVTGKKFKNTFTKATPGLADLLKKINTIYYKTERDRYGPWIPSLDGGKIYCDSSHKALNYLLQSFEAISCKAAVAYGMKKFEEEGLDVKPLVFYHDEYEVECKAEDAERVREIMVEGFREAAKEFGCEILDGDGKIGANWYQVH